jgi:hypothetical protein
VSNVLALKNRPQIFRPENGAQLTLLPLPVKHDRRKTEHAHLGVDVMITIFCDFRQKNWRFSQKP